MKNLLTFLSILFSLGGFAQDIIEPCKFGQPLIDALQSQFTPNNPLGYGPARDILYSEIDNVGFDLSGIYTEFTVTLDPNEDPSVSAFQGGVGINAEHVYPQSQGAGVICIIFFHQKLVSIQKEVVVLLEKSKIVILKNGFI